MKRIFSFAFTAIAMLATMLIFAAITLRLTIHAGETSIPNLSGMTVAEASEAALKAGLDLNIENKFYSTTTPAGRILSQAPAAGARVRTGWQVRVTESLGPQQVTIPNVVAEPVRAATMDIRRDQLDLGTLAHMDAPGDPDIVLAQTPPPDAGVDQPRVSLLLSSAASGESSAFVMPSFVGMTYGQANKAAAQLGLRTALLGQTTTTLPNLAAPPAPGTTPAVPNPAQPMPTLGPSGPVLIQSPAAGYRANKGDTVRLTFARLTIPAPPVAPPTVLTPPAPAPVIPH